MSLVIVKAVITDRPHGIGRDEADALQRADVVVNTDDVMRGVGVDGYVVLECREGPDLLIEAELPDLVVSPRRQVWIDLMSGALMIAMAIMLAVRW